MWLQERHSVCGVSTTDILTTATWVDVVMQHVKPLPTHCYPIEVMVPVPVAPFPIQHPAHVPGETMGNVLTWGSCPPVWETDGSSASWLQPFEE